MDDWDSRWMKVARLFASFSKDPSTGVGAVAIDEYKRVLATGYNGFSRGVNDSPERLNNRTTRYALTVHAEINMLVSAERSLKGCTVYIWPLPCCSTCAAALIQAGISRVVAPAPNTSLADRWGESIEAGVMALREAKVIVDILEPEF